MKQNEEGEKVNANVTPQGNTTTQTVTSDNNVEQKMVDISNTTINVGEQPATVQQPTISDYEQSVTDKENALINSFSNLIVENNHHNHQEINNVALHQQNIKTNGKALDIDLVNEDHQLIMRNNSAISNGNGHTDHSLDNKM